MIVPWLGAYSDSMWCEIPKRNFIFCSNRTVAIFQFLIICSTPPRNGADDFYSTPYPPTVAGAAPCHNFYYLLNGSVKKFHSFLSDQIWSVIDRIEWSSSEFHKNDWHAELLLCESKPLVHLVSKYHHLLLFDGSKIFPAIKLRDSVHCVLSCWYTLQSGR